MMVLLQKWEVRFRRPNKDDIVIYLSDNHLQNIVRKAADIEIEDCTAIQIQKKLAPSQEEYDRITGATPGFMPPGMPSKQ